MNERKKDENYTVAEAKFKNDPKKVELKRKVTSLSSN